MIPHTHVKSQISRDKAKQMIRTYERGSIQGLVGQLVRTIFVALSLGLMLGGCTTTQSPKRQLDDNAIHAAVTTKLTAAHFSNLLNVDVNVTNGIVTLAGQVPNAAVKAEAEQEVRRVSGVVGVVNNLQVKSP